MTKKQIWYDPVAGVVREWDWPDDTGVTETAALQTPVTSESSTTGTILADSSATGKVGEFIQKLLASGSAVSVTTNTATDVTTQALTAGDWDVYGQIVCIGASITAAATSPQQGWINTTATTLPGLDLVVTEVIVITTTSVTFELVVPHQRISSASAVTLSLSVKAQFSAGTMTAWGRIEARRVR